MTSPRDLFYYGPNTDKVKIKGNPIFIDLLDKIIIPSCY